MLSKETLTHFKVQLERLLARAGENQTELRDEAMCGTGGEGSGGISNVPVHPADLGNRATEEEVSLRLLENEERLIEEINLALARIEERRFGKCEQCGHPIDRTRLAALPYTRHCIGCARRVERPRGE